MDIKPNYWIEKRTVDLRLVNELKGEEAVKHLLPLYEQALNNINRQIKDVYRRFSDKSGFKPEQLKQAIQGTHKGQVIANIKKNVKALGLDFDKLYSEGHIKAITNLEAFKENVYWEIMQIAPQERAISGKTYADVVQHTYGGVNNVIANAYGANSLLGGLDTYQLNAMLSSKWAGRNFSDSVWGNTNALAVQLPDILGGAMLSGESYEKTAQRLRERFGVSKFQAKRLVLTEAAYYAGLGEYNSYKDNAIEEYTFSALLDSKTSYFCDPNKKNPITGQSGMGGKTFKLSEAVVGYNYPPLHPFCRSSTYAVLPDFATWSANQERVSREGKNLNLYTLHEPKPAAVNTLSGTQVAIRQPQALPVNNLTKNELGAIANYQSSYYRQINSCLRYGDKSGVSYDFMLGHDLNVIDTVSYMDSAIAKSVLPKDKKLYRGVDLAVYGDKNIGDIIQDKGYGSFSGKLSTAKNYSTARGNVVPAVIELEVPKGSTVLDTSVTGKGYINGDEFILPRNTKLYVKDKQIVDGQVRLTLSYDIVEAPQAVPAKVGTDIEVSKQALSDLGWEDNMIEKLPDTTVRLIANGEVQYEQLSKKMIEAVAGKGTQAYYRSSANAIVTSADTYMQEILHEVGHSIDYQYGALRDTQEFADKVKGAGAREIIVNRLKGSVSDKYILTDSEVRELMVGLKVKKEYKGKAVNLAISKSTRRYMLSKNELWAEGYAQYKLGLLKNEETIKYYEETEERLLNGIG